MPRPTFHPARTVLVGAGGLVATAIARRWSGRTEVIELRHKDLDITSREDVVRAIATLGPRLLINCAVIGVDACERDEAVARAVNVDGVGFLASTAEEIGAEFIHFSSNYVFAGNQQKEYTIEDEPRPISAYGRTKLEGERVAAEQCSRTYVVRTSWVFGERKQNFLSTVPSRLRRGDAVDAICDLWASTTYAADLAERLEEILGYRTYATYHVANRGVCTHEEFARAAAAHMGADPSLIHPITHAGRQFAPRPRYTPMRCLVSERLGLSPLRHWRTALVAYIDGVNEGGSDA